MKSFLTRAILTTVALLSIGSLWLCNTAEAAGAEHYALLGAYMTQAGALKTFSQGDVIDPYFGMLGLLLAKQFGLNDNFAANRFIHWVLSTQRPDGRFNKYCRKGYYWYPCGDSDSEDTTLARWVDLLYTQARDNGRRSLPASWHNSATVALSALAAQRLPSGVYSVFPSSKKGYAGYALFKDNVETYNSFEHIASIESSWGQARRARAMWARAKALKIAMLKAFGRNPLHLRRLALGASYNKVMFYPQVVAAPVAWLDGYFKGTPADWYQWLHTYQKEWFANARVDYPWGILALEALKVGDTNTAACWLAHSRIYRQTNTHWNLIEEISAQIVTLRTRGVTCSR